MNPTKSQTEKKEKSVKQPAVIPPTSEATPRVVIEKVSPEVDRGRFPAKRAVGERVVVEADIFADGHDSLSAVLLFRKEGTPSWTEIPMEPLVNDRWRGEFSVTEIGRYQYTLEGWIDRFQSWRRDLSKKVETNQDVSTDLSTGAGLVEKAGERAPDRDAKALKTTAAELRNPKAERVRIALGEELFQLMKRNPDRTGAVRYEKELTVVVDREKARFNAWYELFPRSCADGKRHGTFKDCEARLPYLAEMGFNVLYFPPIHPIGTAHRKGKNNATKCTPKDPGSPWAIGGKEGGHKAIHPELGTLEDFRALVAKAKDYGMEVALDLAYQCSPDHPYVKEHPEWFWHRPDGTIRHAENPPKKYEDIYPLNFETSDREGLWKEMKSIVLFWIEQGVRIFRVDNPHTKPFLFWEWLIAEIKRDHPDVILLSEAFTRPKVMVRLAKIGFTQSYTYFAWRNAKWELTDYFTELTQSEVREFFRPSLWPNTPDILTEYLQWGGRPAFAIRFILAATLGASYGIYGPAFELCENRPLEPGKEEYLDSEKYEIKKWDLSRAESIKETIVRVNRIRKQNPALQLDWNLRFHPIGNDQLIAYSKCTRDLSNCIVVVVNLDPHHTQSGWLELPLDQLGLDPSQSYQMHDLLTDAKYLWNGPRNYVELNPHLMPAHLFRIRHKVKTEYDFDYFL